ncbi:hypothetical protein TeGR_g12684, partial [Tetraparma gracilis]
KSKDATLKSIASGLLYGHLHPDADIAAESATLFDGLCTHVLLLLQSNGKAAVRVSSAGKVIDDADLASSAGSTLPPLGTFRLLGALSEGANPFVINDAIVELLCSGGEAGRAKACAAIQRLVEISNSLSSSSSPSAKPKKGSKKKDAEGGSSGAPPNLLFEHLLNSLCGACFSKPWNLKAGVYSGIATLCVNLPEWTRSNQTLIITTSLFILKDSPREVSSAAVKGSMGFLVKTLALFHGELEGDEEDWQDALTLRVEGDFGGEEEEAVGAVGGSPPKLSPLPPSDPLPPQLPPTELTMMLLNELVSPKHIVRFGARHALQHFALAHSSPLEGLLAPHASYLKQLLFSRNLRILPLAQQVGVVETLAFTISRSPSTLPLSDSNVVASLNELLVVIAALDESPSGASSGDSASAPNTPTSTPNTSSTPAGPGGGGGGSGGSSSTSHASAVFLRGPSVVGKELTGGITITVPGELPHSVQLRVSALLLFRAIIKHHSEEFLSAEPSTGLGAIRVQVMGLFFRSLVSSPAHAAAAAHAGLKEVLDLNEKRGGEGGAGGAGGEGGDAPVIFGLPQDTLQQCLRPILTRLNDYKQLSLSLTEGLAKLLGLLSSRFNKTFGDKLLDHLHHWLDPAALTNLKIWRAGEEPLVAASVINLFELLPQGTAFVERLVTTVINLESTLHQFKGYNQAHSPYRLPLTRYLTQYCEQAVEFFLDPKRLSNASYSSLFVAILKTPEAKELRAFLSEDAGTKKILNVCFGIPLYLDNQLSGKGAEEQNAKATHGVPEGEGGGWGDESAQSTKVEQCKQDLAAAGEKLKVAENAHMKAQSALGASKAGDAGFADAQREAAAAGELLEKAQGVSEACEKALKEETDKRNSEFDLAESAVLKLIKGEKPGDGFSGMSQNALEWQHLGLKVFDVMIKNDD